MMRVFLALVLSPVKPFFEGKDGTIWIGADDRLTVFNPGNEVSNTTAPNIQLTGLTLFNENISWQNLISRLKVR